MSLCGVRYEWRRNRGMSSLSIETGSMMEVRSLQCHGCMKLTIARNEFSAPR